jgi:hypothetical protein
MVVDDVIDAAGRSNVGARSCRTHRVFEMDEWQLARVIPDNWQPAFPTMSIIALLDGTSSP